MPLEMSPPLLVCVNELSGLTWMVRFFELEGDLKVDPLSWLPLLCSLPNIPTRSSTIINTNGFTLGTIYEMWGRSQGFSPWSYSQSLSYMYMCVCVCVSIYKHIHIQLLCVCVCVWMMCLSLILHLILFSYWSIDFNNTCFDLLKSVYIAKFSCDSLPPQIVITIFVTW